MDARVKKVGEIGQDNLIAGIYPPAEVTGIKVAAGQGLLCRGTVVADGGNGCTVLNKGMEGKALYILADDVDTGGGAAGAAADGKDEAAGGEEKAEAGTDAGGAVSAVAYRTGNFNTSALTVAQGYELTAADRDALRKYSIVLNDNMQ